jgi:hypothetical protein
MGRHWSTLLNACNTLLTMTGDDSDEGHDEQQDDLHNNSGASSAEAADEEGTPSLSVAGCSQCTSQMT